MAPRFVNQVPTASGLAGPNVDKTRNIDLVKKVETDVYEFIELKVSSDTPVMAAFEIYSNAATYAYYRATVGPSKKGAKDQPILSASRVALRTLAPQSYYRELDLWWLETLLNKDLELYRREQDGQSVFTDFAFLAFPADFVWPRGAAGSGMDMSLHDAVAGIDRVYG